MLVTYFPDPTHRPIAVWTEKDTAVLLSMSDRLDPIASDLQCRFPPSFCLWFIPGTLDPSQD